ncbi:MAG: phosphopantetheine-binding protein [Dorea sp.]|nr:phosphopantetheine-binding protein [Dorea sp.]
MKDTILEICQDLLPRIDFENETALIDDGILDSMSIIAIASELSLEFDVEFDVDELQPENMNSIDAMVATVKMLQGE